MRIWLDLANSPQVLFFRPILSHLIKRGHEVQITTRDYAQTIQLANQYGLQHHTIGRHGGSGLVGLMRENLIRGLELARWAKPRKFDLAISHNAYSQIFAALLLRITSVTLMDYEHQPLNHFGFRFANRVIVPEVFPPELIRKYGAKAKTDSYPGIKEQVYLADFKAVQDFRTQAELPTNCPLVVIRPPATWTAYHRFENQLFDQLLAYLNSHSESFNLFLPRMAEQTENIRQWTGIHIANRVYDGPNLLNCADLVISGGGTMNREAAVLGTPTYTVFKGRSTAVDNFLIEKGRLVEISEPEDFPKIKVEIKDHSGGNLINPGLLDQVTDLILNSWGVE